jgi:hypothetical protein
MKLWKKGFEEEEEEEEQDLHLREIFLFVQEMKPLLRRSLEGKQDRCSFGLVSRERERQREMSAFVARLSSLLIRDFDYNETSTFCP